MPKPPKRPRDMMQLAKYIGEIATGEREDADMPRATEKRPGRRRTRKKPRKAKG